VTPRDDFEHEDRKTPSKRKWERRPEREEQPRAPKRPKQRRPDEVVWDWEDDAEEYENGDVESTDDDVADEVVDDDLGDDYDTGYDEEDER